VHASAVASAVFLGAANARQSLLGRCRGDSARVDRAPTPAHVFARREVRTSGVATHVLAHLTDRVRAVLGRCQVCSAYVIMEWCPGR
jgi:hypothetical protein